MTLCSHIQSAAQTPHITAYRAILSFLRNYKTNKFKRQQQLVAGNNTPSKSVNSGPSSKGQSQVTASQGLLKCQHCSKAHMLYLCLDCPSVHCRTSMKIHQTSSHGNDLTASQQHNFYVSADYGWIYCLLCNDYIHNSPFERIKKNVGNVGNNSFGGKENGGGKGGIKGSGRSTTVAEDLVVVSTSSNNVLPCSAGLRGLYNLGNTCFMNAVLQSLVQNPLLGSFFLSGAHQAMTCTAKYSTQYHICLACEFDLLYTKFYSGDTKPFAPHTFLYSIWLSSQLAGYEQQDAHEFFIAILNGLHQNLTGGTMAATTHKCPCIIHRTFSGTLQSTVTCQKCSFSSIAIDPFLDISLDFDSKSPSPSISPENTMTESLQPSLAPSNNTQSHQNSIGSSASASTSAKNSIAESLKRYTLPEDISSFMCSHCLSYQAASKQLRFESLPPVLAFHLKRFEHKSSAQKLDDVIQFPNTLSMSPFMSNNSSGSSSPKFYSLFAVINHVGSLESGHYFCFVKHNDDWFKIDDAWITKSSLDEALESQPYMIFYLAR